MNLPVNFPVLCIIILVMWVIGLLVFPHLPWLGRALVLAGTGTLLVFLIVLWVSMGRPPMRTLGETRLWYAGALPPIALILGWRWRMSWPLYYAVPLAGLFLLITLLSPESWDKTLMPALRSPWFVPHVLAYLLAYAFLSASFIAGLRGLQLHRRNKSLDPAMILADSSVRIGFALLTLGLVIGAIWAKEAWGHYWTWDPKETWALLTWLAYLAFLHFRLQYPERRIAALSFVTVAFLVLLVCWFGLNYLPIGQASVHTYSN